jgi:predicted hydrolase (HD superfamily)
MDVVTWADGEARRRLGPLGARWTHSMAVAARAREVARVSEPDDRPVLVAAALLHDIGYDPQLVVTGFHPLDGARWLATQGHGRLAGLVAHHSRASFEADELGLRAALDEFADESSAVSDALTYCDLTTGDSGERVRVADRLSDIERRYGADSVVGRALTRASGSLLAAVERTEDRLSRAGVAQGV